MRGPRALKLLPLLLAVAGLVPIPPGAAAECTPPADAMPHGEGHDHADRGQHALACGLELIAYRDLAELVPEAVMFGEIDAAAGVAAMAVSYPEAGLVTFDVTDPTDPRPLARFYGPPCEEVVYDIDCGTDVKLTPDGRTAFLSTQYTTRVPAAPRNPHALLLPPQAGIFVVDLSDPSRPELDSFLPVEPLGVHMLAYHEIGGHGYVFAIDNALGLAVARLERHAGRATLIPIVREDDYTAGGHDVFLYDDPVDDATYLYIASPERGLVIYDATNPVSLEQVGAWRAPAGRSGDWYYHSVWTFRWEERRYSLVVPELFRGRGSRDVGPVWLVDVTDHAAPVLVATWTNPAGRAAGNLGFSPHNVWFDDGHSYLAHYHGGVWLLDWRPVLDGLAANPVEVGYHVPHAAERAFVQPISRRKFITGFDMLWRPSVWDVEGDRGVVYASDINGGFYVLAPESER